MNDYKKTILQKTEVYLKQLLEKKFHRIPRVGHVTCPKCNAVACYISPKLDYHMDCKACNWQGNIVDVVRFKEPSLANSSEDEIFKYLAGRLDVEIVTVSDIETMLKLYHRLGFDMVSVRHHLKAPFELDWQKKSYKNIEDWEKWLDEDLNIGVKTGIMSGITVIDVDCKNISKAIPDELKPFLTNIDTLIQETQNGYHYFFEYEKDLPKTGFDIVVDPDKQKKFHIDVENDGGQVVVFPSIVHDEKTGKTGFDRKFNIDQTKLHGLKIAKMPDELKQLLLKKLGTAKSGSENPFDVIDLEKCQEVMKIEEGNRNNFLIHIGGILRKELNPSETEKVLGLLNRFFVKPPLQNRELHDNIFRPLRKYMRADESELAKKILDYLRIVGEANATDIRTAINETKYSCDKATEALVREGYLFKKRKSYHLIKRAEWSDKWGQEGEEVQYEIPYFHDKAYIRDGDMIIIGAKTGDGKTHVAMNMVKKLKEQGIKPYYISLESGSRFVHIAKKLTMGEGDFYHTTLFSPQDVELEPDAVTIIDWLLPDDYSETDKLYKYFAEQLVKQKGVLIVFVQLKESKDQENKFFAENMIKMFPALVVKFGYHRDSKGEETPERSFFKSVKIRDPKSSAARFQINMRYDFDNKTLEIEKV